MKHYPEEHKKAVVRKLIESGLSLRQFAKLEGMNLSTLYSWRDKYLKVGPSLKDSINADSWSPEQNSQLC
ncbi:transposase [Alteromonas sp. V450]|uniref:transposase n=1 Tax=Alteromonas sp. V450 TaxID=1912139 RepID=UPI0009FABDDB